MNGHCVGYYTADGKLEQAAYFNGPTSEVVARLVEIGFTQLRHECAEHDRAICRNPTDGRWAIDLFVSDNISEVHSKVIAISTALNEKDIIPILNKELDRLTDATRAIS